MSGFTSLVVEADPLARRRTVLRLVGMGSSEVIEAASADEALARLRSTHCDVCVVDVDLPDGTVFELIASLHDQGCHGMVVAPPPSRVDDFDELSDLSAREISVLEMVAAGRSNKQIGEALLVSALTVKSHLARMARKLGTGDRAAMVAWGMRSGVIS